MSFFDDSLLDMLDVYIYESNDLFEQLDRILLTHQQDHALTKEDIHAYDEKLICDDEFD